MYKLVQTTSAVVGNRQTIDQSPREFVETMNYTSHTFSDPHAFQTHFYSIDWVNELHDTLSEFLDPNRRVFSIGSGECEHEVRFMLKGYSVVASDISEQAFQSTQKLFPTLKVIPYDVFKSHPTEIYDDVLITGLDFYFDQAKVEELFLKVRPLLRPGGRLIFVLRLPDTWMTRMIDWVITPIVRYMLNIRNHFKNRPARYFLKHHGYRRSVSEISELATKANFSLNRVAPTCAAAELIRLGVDSIAPTFYAWVKRLDKRLKWFHSSVVMEFYRRVFVCGWIFDEFLLDIECILVFL